MTTRKKIVLTITTIIALIIVLLASSVIYFFGGLNTVALDQNDSALNIDSDFWSKMYSNDPNSKDIQNIALFGTDTNSSTEFGNSDAIIILSIDRKNNKIKLSSIARDTYVTSAVEDIKNTKINHAYASGGPRLAIKVINENFNMNIKDFVAVNFTQMEKVIDAVGGVTVNLTAAEKKAAGITGTDPGSAVKLNGKDAVSYSRIRKIDGDDVRTSRQREVMFSMFTNAQTLGAAQLPQFIKEIIPLITTSFDYADLMGLSSVALNKGMALEQTSFPHEKNNAIGGEYKGQWYYRYDLTKAGEMLKKFIYDDVHPDNQ